MIDVTAIPLWDVLLPLLISLVLTIAAAAIIIVVRALRQSETVKQFREKYAVLETFARDAIYRIAVTGVEEKEYQDEAATTGRDVRLVAAYHELEQAAAVIGITLPRPLLISLVERVYQDLKADENVPAVG